jgi:2-succinyl-5-enolpyruvyl-6-hydroxy-3-cyclohexene-1-carboxylate synthase
VSVPTGGSAPGDGDRQAAFAATLVDEWVRAGVTHAVVCPGSRSTPLALAVAAEPRLALHVRLDERSAGFTALGIGMATGSPALVVVTSGTAAAELHAAVVEADLAGVPMLLCTADRPPELRDFGAPQTIDQAYLYGRSVRWFADPGVPDEASRPSWRSLGSRAVSETVHGPFGPGPVQLNLAFRDPLLGDAEPGGIPDGRPDGMPWHRVATGPVPPPPGLVDDLVDTAGFAPGTRGVVVAGAGCGEPDAVLDLAEALSWPVLADPRSGLRSPHPGLVAAADGILRAPRFVARHRPEVVLVLGRSWASKVVTSFITGSRRVVVDPCGSWPDPDRTADRLVRCDPTLLCRELTARVAGATVGGVGSTVGSKGLSTGQREREWAGEWQQAEARARQVVDGLATQSHWTEPALAHQLVAALPAGVRLVVSSSMPVRDVEAFGSPRADPPRVLANRGANGIDGVVSTALGVAFASGPTVALVGDLAFLHDVSALVGPADERAPLTVVVADNGGGGIFAFLPPASSLDSGTFDQMFATPQSADVSAVAAGFDWHVEELDDASGPSALAAALGRAAARGGRTVVRVRLPDRTANVAAHARVNAAIVAAVGG